ncbi:MAG: hypothetical protein IJN46_09940, partial [Lachnospiraceae bacterium]|nr:hypothetical protein [Lachnospiraceae bacterium]
MKKKQTIKLCVVVAVFMLCLCMLVGCSDLTKENPSKENGTPSDIEETMKENETQIDVRWMYQIKRLKIGMTVSNTGNLTMCDEMVYFDGEVEKKDSTDSADRYKAIFSHNLSSAETAVVLFETLEKKLCNEENKLELTGMDVTAEGRLVTVFSEKKFGMPTSERIWLVMMDADGNLLWNAVIEDKRQAGIPLCVEDGIYVPIGNSILVYNTSGSLQNSYTIEQLPEEAGKVDWERGIRRLYRLKDGKEYLAYQEPAAFDAPDMILVEIDLRTGDMGEDIRLINLNNLLYVGEEGHYEFALKTSNGLFGRIEDEDGD